MRPFGEDRARRGSEVAAGGRGEREEGRKREGGKGVESEEGAGRVGDSRRVAGDVGEEEILRLAARGYWKEARRDERRS